MACEERKIIQIAGVGASGVFALLNNGELWRAYTNDGEAEWHRVQPIPLPEPKKFKKPVPVRKP
jgi:hypothetical protein